MLRNLQKLPQLAGHRALFIYRAFLGRFYTPVLVYSIAKTGTSSIKVSLRKQIPNPVYHTHHLALSYFSPSGARTVNERKDLWLSDLVAHADPKTRWKVVTLTREPVIRAISNYFEALENVYLKTGRRVAFDEMIDFLHEQTTDLSDSMFTKPDFWFDTELQDLFDFDIYAQPFEPSQGYAIYHTARADILLIRLEDLSRVGAASLAEFFGVPSITLLKSNERALTVLNHEYRQVQQTLKFPAGFLDSLYAMRYARHFYTSSEVEKFKQRWQA